MQTNTWTDFIDRLAATVGDGIAGEIHAQKSEVRDEKADLGGDCEPTFIATGS